MKKLILGIISILIMALLSGCGGTGEKAATLSAIYLVSAVIAFILLIGCIVLVRKNRKWFIFLFSSVLTVNIGYTLLSLSSNLQMALWANRISYFGSVFLPLSMLMIILNVTSTRYKRWLPQALLCVAVVVFLIAASPGVLDIYYKEVSFAVVDGTSTLIKEYGPLHPIYLVYLLGYFSAMVAVIARATIKKTIDTTSHAICIAMAVFVNIAVWLIEQLSDINFEILSFSYIISELFLLGVHLVMSENQRLREIVKQVETVQKYTDAKNDTPGAMLEKPIEASAVSSERLQAFMEGLESLTPTEKQIYSAYIARVTTKEIMANLGIKESTLKYHNRNIYGKLGVSSRAELLEVHKHIKSVKSALDET